MTVRPDAAHAVAADPGQAGLICDFDGVLAPIVEDPGTSAMPRGVEQTIERLGKRLGLLAIVSGRPLAFLRERVRLTGIPLLGSYGIEQLRDGEPYLAPEARRWLPTVQSASEQLKTTFRSWPGIRIEDKAVSVAVHWRQAERPDEAARQIRQVTAQIAAASGLRVEPGKLVEELRPPIDVDKGTALAILLGGERLSTVVYVGDDLGDIPALKAVRQAGGYALVVDHGAETDSQLLALADQVFSGTAEFAAWLGKLADSTGA